MPEAVLQQKIFPHDGSFDATKHPLLISYKDIVDSNNLIYTTYSTKKKRPGISEAFRKRLPGDSPVLSGLDFWRLGAQKILAYNGNRIFAVDPETELIDDISQNFIIPPDNIVNFSAFQGLAIACFSDGVTSPKAWTQSGQMVDLDADAPNGPFCRIWLNRVWMPDPSIPGRILYTATGTVNFVGGDSGAIDLDINDDDPDGITAIFPPFFGNLYVAKRFSVYKIKPVIISDGSLVFSPLKISDGVGCISHAGVAATPGNLFFPSDEGVHYFTSSDKLSEIDTDEFSKEISPLWQEETNFNRSQYIQGIYDKRLKSYLIAYPSFDNDYPTDVWGFSIPAKKWYRWKDYNQTCLFKYTSAKTKKIQTIVGSNKGSLGIIDPTVTSDYGNPINISFQSGIIAPSGSPDDRYSFKAISPIFVPQLSGAFDITYRIDGRVIETMNFLMQDEDGGDELAQDFILAQSFLGGMPRMKIDKRTLIGNGMLYELYVSHSGIGNDDDGFEMLGILIDLDRINKVVGRTVS